MLRGGGSLCYGFSFLMTFGLGSFGSIFGGHAGSDFSNTFYYLVLAGMALLASSVSLVLWRWNRSPLTARAPINFSPCVLTSPQTPSPSGASMVGWTLVGRLANPSQFTQFGICSHVQARS